MRALSYHASHVVPVIFFFSLLLVLFLEYLIPKHLFRFLPRFYYRPKEIFVFFVGGSTYEEARAIDLFNKTNPGACINVM